MEKAGTATADGEEEDDDDDEPEDFMIVPEGERPRRSDSLLRHCVTPDWRSLQQNIVGPCPASLCDVVLHSAGASRRASAHGTN